MRISELASVLSPEFLPGFMGTTYRGLNKSIRAVQGRSDIARGAGEVSATYTGMKSSESGHLYLP